MNTDTSIYQDTILDHYRNPRNSKSVPALKNRIRIINPLCGDVIEMGMRIHAGTIVDIGYTSVGCAISIASASILTTYAKGKKVSSLKKMQPSTMMKLLGIPLSPSRIKCGLIAFEAFQKLLILTDTSHGSETKKSIPAVRTSHGAKL